LENFIFPVIGELKDPTAIYIPFFKDKDNTYILELGVYDSTDGSADVGYLRVWSQDQLLFQKTGSGAGTISTTTYYESASTIPWTEAELSTLKFTQSGDIIFVCCPTRKPYRIFRTLITTATTRASDDSFWTVDEFVMTDGPYKSINYYSEDDDDKKFTLKLTTEPTTSVEIGTVEFNTVDDSLVLANHGLQTGQRIKLEGKTSGKGWGNLRQTVTTGDSSLQTKMNGAATGSGSDIFNLDGFVVSSTGTSFQWSDDDGGPVRKFELVTDDPVTTTTNAHVVVHKYVYVAHADARSLTLYNDGDTGSAGSNLTNTYFSGDDVGRLIRINPLTKGGSLLGGIKWCWGIINTVVNSVITVEFKTEMSNTRDEYGTSEFRLGAFSDGEGWPHVAQIYQQRMVLAATTVQPSTIWLSETAQFYSFAPTVLVDQGTQQSFTDGMAIEIVIDSSSLTFTLDSDTLDEIKWLAESKKLTMGTSAGVFMLYGAETNLTVTPFRFTINRETSFSATDTAPVVVSNALIYAQIGGKDVQSLELEGGSANQWLASKISMKGYDIIKSSEVLKMVWQERPNNLIWFMMADGRLLTLSYDRGAEFKAWSEHLLGGSIYRKIITTSQSTVPTEVVVSDSSADEVADSGNKILLTDEDHALVDNNIVQLTTTGTLPTGLSLSTNYYVRNKTDDTFKLALASGGADILWIDDGAGDHSWHKPTMYTVAGDQTSMFVTDKYATVSNYTDSNWNVSQEIINVLSTGGNTEITTRLDSSEFNGTASTNAIIEADGNSHAQVTDIDMIPTASHDQIWLKVKRTINGSDIHHVETIGRFPTEGALDRNEYVFSDSAVTGSVPASKIISGLKHLRNEEVQIYYEGMQHTNLTVTNTGGSDETVTLSHTQGNEHVTGLAYDAELETLEPSAPDNQFSYTKRLIKVAVLIEESLGIQLEYNDLSEELLFRTTQDAMGRQIPLFSGLRKLSLSGIGWEAHNLKIVSNGPFPMQLNAVIIEAETGGS